MPDETKDRLNGAASGAMMGTMVAPGFGTVIGAGLGAAGILGGSSGGSGPSYGNWSPDTLYNQRMSDINNFSDKLATARQSYLTNLQNLQNITLRQTAQDMGAAFGARGMDVTGGGFQSALARYAAPLIASGQLEASNMERNDLTNVANMKNGAQGQMVSGAYGNQAQQNQNNIQGQQAVGGLLGNALNSYMYGQMYNPQGGPTNRPGGALTPSNNLVQAGTVANGMGITGAQDYNRFGNIGY
jgi:hypothetical protein